MADPRVTISPVYDSEHTGWAPVPGAGAVPLRFRADIDDPGLDYLVRLDVIVVRGTAEVRELVVLRREDRLPIGLGISTVGLRRINLGRYLRAALAAAKVQRTDIGGGGFVVEQSPDAAFVAPSVGGRGKQTPQGRLEVAANAYNAAKEAGTPAIRAVMDACFVKESQASRLIRAARAAGLIASERTTVAPVPVEAPDDGQVQRLDEAGASGPLERLGIPPAPEGGEETDEEFRERLMRRGEYAPGEGDDAE